MSKSLIAYFYENEKNRPNEPYLHQPFGDNWETYTWAEVGEKARRLATWLKKQCPKEKAHISIVSRNCREWAISDLAVMMAGFISVPFYANLNGKQLGEVITLGEVDLLLFGKVDGWEDMKTGIPKGMPVGRFPFYEGTEKVDIGVDWETIMQEAPLEGNPTPNLNDIWSIIFTSGTTGTPKGAYYDHRKVGIVAESPHFDYWFDITPKKENRFFSFLPLNHIAERHLLVCSISKGVQVFFTESLERFGQNLNDAKPTIFFAVPRIWTKLKQGVLNKMPQKRLDTLLRIPFVSGIIKKKLKTALGLDKARVVITGAAPMSKHDVDWWLKLGFPLSDAYGQTENFAICSYSPVGKIKTGAVGIAQEGVELKIHPDNQELLVKSKVLMNGYYKDEQKTKETISNDGWLFTGDAAKIDEDGYLYITGRVKDTFKTEKGQFIVPAKVENLFGANEDIEQLCLLGLGMPHPIMVVVPSELGAGKSKADFENSLATTMDAANKKLPNYTRVGTILIAKDAFSVENGLLTPTLKVKRMKMNEKYRDDLRSYCEDSRKIIWE